MKKKKVWPIVLTILTLFLVWLYIVFHAKYIELKTRIEQREKLNIITTGTVTVTTTYSDPGLYIPANKVLSWEVVSGRASAVRIRDAEKPEINEPTVEFGKIKQGKNHIYRPQWIAYGPILEEPIVIQYTISN